MMTIMTISNKNNESTQGMHPDRKQCIEYLNEYGTPPHVIGHCKAVASVAYKLGAALNKAGGTFDKNERSGKERSFDLRLVLAGGLLHDMARVEDRHWDVCADWCHSKGFFEEEEIIRVHMQYQFTKDVCHLSEVDLVCLGDRLTLEDRYAGLDERMDYIIKKAEKNGKLEAKPIILKKKEETKKLLDSIEERIGQTIDSLMIDIDYDKVEEK